jgi:Zn-dependent M28 family amino/carboxypeptidase
VKQLSQQERDKIVAYINLDMTASPNYILGVQDNDNSGGGRPPWIPVPPLGSNAVERILQDAFKSMALNCTGFAVEPNSDHAPFLGTSFFE